ncbi:MAG: rhodanese-like domain-containing protein [Candidatus Omnitrophica bacterium]|nr:rhodanese-like domain-containing protein [Candidatus Omnitrophota bacterium]
MIQAKAITKEKLWQKLKRGEEVQVVNVLDSNGYTLGLIKGSKKIPLAELDQRIDELDKSKEVVTYCAGYACSTSKIAAEKLTAKGFKVKAYEGGIIEWKEAGLPIEEPTTKPSPHSSCCG